MQKKTIILIAGAVLAVVGVVMGKAYLDQQSAQARAQLEQQYKKRQESQVEVLFAKTAIPKGATIDVDQIEIKRFSRDQVGSDAVTSFGRISGMTVNVPIARGEQITLDKLAYQRQGDLAAITPVGKRAISITVDALASLGGMIKPGDYVDAIAMVPIAVPTAEGKTATQLAVMPLFQNVLVLAVGTETGAASGQSTARYRSETKKAEPTDLITLALAPQEASLIAFVQEQGKIRLILRSPTDAKMEAVRPASWDTLFQYVMPAPPPEQETARKAPAKPAETVEIYRGLNREEVPLK